MFHVSNGNIFEKRLTVIFTLLYLQLSIKLPPKIVISNF